MFGNIRLPEITKNLIIINAIMMLALYIYPDLGNYVALYYFSYEKFEPWQLVTHMFSHAGPMHLFSNMFTLFMFGSVLENVIGHKRFLTFYLLTGFGGAFLHMLFNIVQVYTLSGHIYMTPEIIDSLNIPIANKLELINIISIPMLGASGAVFGVLIGFAFFFPNSQMMLLFPPIPVRTKTMVTILILYELWMGYNQFGNIAHFAHLGGALFGYFILKSWRRRGIL